MSVDRVQLNFSIRRARRDDLPQIVRLLADDPLGSQREKFVDPLPESYYDACLEIDRDPNNVLIVAEASGEIIGTLQLTFIPSLTYQGGKRAQIEAVRIAPEYRSQGLGRRLFEWTIERPREAQCHLVQLTTNDARPHCDSLLEGRLHLLGHSRAVLLRAINTVSQAHRKVIKEP